MPARPRPLLVLGLLAALVLAGVTAAPSAPAAQPDTRGAGLRSAEQPPGKGDSDGDGIADDLAAALSRADRGDRLSVIVQGTTPARARAAASTLRLDRKYRSIVAFAGSVTAGQVRALTRVPGVSRVELNGVTRAMDASGNLDYGVTAARGAATTADGTLDGSGVGICVIDTGIDPNHEFLAGRVVGWKDWVNARPDPYDDHGHGTHVSGIAAGRPTSAANAPYGGVATGAVLVGAKVLAANGFGADADVVSAIEWCAARPDVHVISMSLGSPGSDGSDAGSQAADAAIAAGKVVVAAAGNDGDAPGTISSPGVATDVITVGAASDPSGLSGPTDTDAGIYLAGFSGRGPTTNSEAPTKPDVVAPGLSVVSAKAGTTGSYVTMSGTSMATPFVSGVVALGLEATPSATPAEVKQALMSTAEDAGAPGKDDEWGQGLVDARAFVAALGAAPAGSASWPAHQLIEDAVGSGATVDFPFDVTTGGQPLGVTLRTANGHATCLLQVGAACWYGYEWSPDLDAYLVNPSGTIVAVSRCMLEATNNNCGALGRVETLGIASAVAGTWKLRVESYSGAGSFMADVFGDVGPADPGPTVPDAPTALTAGAMSASATSLSWTDASSDEDGFALERCQGVDCTGFALLATLPAGTTTYDDTGLTADTTYSYRVRAINAAGSSAWSNTASATTLPLQTPPSAPTGLTAVASAGGVTLAWTDASSNEVGFRVLRCKGTKCTPTAVVVTLAPDVVTWTDVAVLPRTTYRYRIRAYNSAGVGTSGIVTVKTPR